MLTVHGTSLLRQGVQRTAKVMSEDTLCARVIASRFAQYKVATDLTLAWLQHNGTWATQLATVKQADQQRLPVKAYFEIAEILSWTGVKMPTDQLRALKTAINGRQQFVDFYDGLEAPAENIGG